MIPCNYFNFLNIGDAALVSGAEMISRAAVDAGVNFFAGYPITPASSIYATMLSKLQAQGKVAIGASDEISGIAMCIGAAMRGAKAMTATSAPGLALMTENIGYAFATETPLLIVLGQRLGPSTGAATQSAEGDISLVANLISGGYQIPVLAPNSILNCYETTINAINISEKYRTPVILLTEKDIVMSSKNIDPIAIPENLPIINRKFFGPGDKNFKTYDFQALQDVPDFLPAGGNGDNRVVITGSIHDKAGNLSKTSPEALEVARHLYAKIADNADDMTFYESYNVQSQQAAKNITVISFLATDLAAREAVIKAKLADINITHLTLFTLFPIPEKIIKEHVQDADLVIIPEENLTGQYADMIKHLLVKPNGQPIPLKKVNVIGRLISPQEILKAFSKELQASS